jgi:predicted anti-sigma-YlaC factor YlaD
MKKIMNKLMLSCLKASELIEKKLNSKLSTKEKIQLSLHTSMCDACRAWEKQSTDLDHTLNEHISESNRTDSSDTLPLSDKARKAILEKIKKG